MLNKLIICLVSFFFSGSWFLSAAEARYHVGRGLGDITGPAAEIGMPGYARLDQKSAGIHTRQWARAFIVVDPVSEKRVVFVSLDTSQD